MVLQSHVKRPIELVCAVPEPERTEFVETSETVTIDGRVMQRPVLKEVRISEKFKGLKVIDFTLENLAAVGALDGLSEVKLIGLDGKSIDDAISRSDALYQKLQLTSTSSPDA